jgi:circadian clock protein KaiB
VQNKPLTNAYSEVDEEEKYILRLFITGASPNSVRAVGNIREFCEHYLKNKYELEIIDVHQQPEIAQEEQLLALPLLIRKFPSPEKRLIGDMSDTQKILKGLGMLNR